MFGGLKLGGSLRAKAFAKLQEERREGPKKSASSVKQDAQAEVEIEWDLPDPRSEWEVLQEQRKVNLQRAKTEADAKMAQRAEASARQAERRRQYSQHTATNGPDTSPNTGASSSSAYVYLYAHYRGLNAPHSITLTDDEYFSYTCGNLKNRIARESGVLMHSQGKLLKCSKDARPTQILKDSDLLRAVLKDQDHVLVQSVESEKFRPASAPQRRTHHTPRTPQQAEEAAVKLKRDTLWRGARGTEPPASLQDCERSYLLRFLQQAGVKADLACQVDELAQVAADCLPAWEAERVLACENWLEVLRLKENPSLSEIKAAFRKVSMAVHPDKNNSDNATEAMRRVTRAYQGLVQGNKENKA